MTEKETQHETEEVGDEEEVGESNEGMSASRRGVLKGIGTGAALTAAGVAPSQLDDVEGLVGDSEAIAPAVVGIYAGAAAVGGGRAFENVFGEDDKEELQELVGERLWEETYQSAIQARATQEDGFQQLINQKELLQNYVEQQISFSVYEGVQEGLSKEDVKDKAEDEALEEIAVIEENLFNTWEQVILPISRRVELVDEDEDITIEDVFDERGVNTDGGTNQSSGVEADDGFGQILDDVTDPDGGPCQYNLVDGRTVEVNIVGEIYGGTNSSLYGRTESFMVPFARYPDNDTDFIDIVTDGYKDGYGTADPIDVLESWINGTVKDDYPSVGDDDDVKAHYELVVAPPPDDEDIDLVYIANSYRWMQVHEEIRQLADDAAQMADDRTELLHDAIDGGDIENPGEIFSPPSEWGDIIGDDPADANEAAGYYRQLGYAEGSNPVEVVLENGAVGEGVIFRTGVSAEGDETTTEEGEHVAPDNYAGSFALSLELTRVPDIPEDEDGELDASLNEDPLPDFDAPDSWDDNTAAAGRMQLVAEDGMEDGDVVQIAASEGDVLAWDVTDTEFVVTSIIGDGDELEFEGVDLGAASEEIDDYEERLVTMVEREQDTQQSLEDLLEDYDDDGGAVSGDGVGDDNLIAILAGIVGLGAVYAAYKSATQDMEVDTPELRE